MRMSAVTVTFAPGVDALGGLSDDLRRAKTAVAPMREYVTRFQDHMREMRSDPKAMYELALYRLRDAVEHALAALTTRRGRAYLQGEHIEEAATPKVVIAALGHIRPKWHQRSIERVTRLRAPRAQLPRTFA